jgi:hypothetical protein
MQQGNYWRKVQEARVSRRKVLKGGAALGVGVAGLAIAGCSDDKKDGAKTSTGGTRRRTLRRRRSRPRRRRRAASRSFGFDALALDSFDPHPDAVRTEYNMHSAVFSKVLQYDDDANMVMSADLADGMPEQPDRLTTSSRSKGVRSSTTAPAPRQLPRTSPAAS